MKHRHTDTTERFLIHVPSKDWTSELLNTFSDVQHEMNRIEKRGWVTGVRVEQYIGHRRKAHFTYDFDGEFWEKRPTR